MILKFVQKMIFSSIFIPILFQVFVTKSEANLCDDPSIDPIQIVCFGVNLLDIFVQFDPKKIEYLLWTRQNAGDDEVYKLGAYNQTSLNSSPFNGAKKTYTFVHGYTNTGYQKWILEAKTKILDLEDANIISLNFWELVARPNSDLDYLPAVCNSYKVGHYSAYVFNWLSENSELDRTRIHLIGHSLGAHIAGVMAYYMIKLPIGKVSRITGLDPAGVLFNKVINEFKLDKCQADFVDIIHTNGCDLAAILCYGLGDVMGHVDFFPNGGILQPGCNNITNFQNCSHERAPLLYVESIEPVNLEFTSWPLDNTLCKVGVRTNDCGKGCLNMGFHVPTNSSGTYCLATNGQSPYAQGDNP